MISAHSSKYLRRSMFLVYLWVLPSSFQQRHFWPELFTGTPKSVADVLAITMPVNVIHKWFFNCFQWKNIDMHLMSHSYKFVTHPIQYMVAKYCDFDKNCLHNVIREYLCRLNAKEIKSVNRFSKFAREVCLFYC